MTPDTTTDATTSKATDQNAEQIARGEVGKADTGDAVETAATTPTMPETALATATGPATPPRRGQPGEDEAHVQRAQEQLILLRQQQEQIERQKRELEELNRRQGEFEAARGEISRKLARAVVTLEREQYEAEKEVERLRACRAKLEHQISVLEGINPSGWARPELGRELNRAISCVEDAETELGKASAQVNCERSGDAIPLGGEARASLGDLGFGGWFKAGVAFTLPLFLLLTVAFALFFYFLFNILAGGG